MNRGLIAKFLRDSRWLRWGALFGIVLFEVLFTRIMREIDKEYLGMLLSSPFFSRLINMLIGSEIGGDLNITVLLTVGFAHPVLFTLTWAVLLTDGTRVLVGELERGTLDLTLALPVSRWDVFLAATVSWLPWGIPMSLAPLFGAWIGGQLFYEEPIAYARLAPMTLNLFGLYVAVGGLTMLVATFHERRGIAIGTMVIVMLSSFLLNFLASMWDALEPLSRLGLLNYYKTIEIYRNGLPVTNTLILVGFGLVAWIVGLRRFATKDIHAA